MAFCIYCGSKLPDEAAFCIKCGAAVQPSREDGQPDGVQQAPAAVNEPETEKAPMTGGDSAPAEQYAAGGEAENHEEAPKTDAPAEQAQTFYTSAQPNAAYQYTVQPAAPKKKLGALFITIIVLFAALIVVGVVLLAMMLGSGSGQKTPYAAFKAFNSAVVDGNMDDMADTIYEFTFYGEDELDAYLENDKAEYGYSTEDEQVDDWLSIFIYNHADYGFGEESPLYYIGNGVDDIKVLSFDAENADSAGDDQYVACTATLSLDGYSMDDTEVTLSYYMTRSDGQWFVVYSD